VDAVRSDGFLLVVLLVVLSITVLLLLILVSSVSISFVRMVLAVAGLAAPARRLVLSPVTGVLIAAFVACPAGASPLGA
jgi:hypothetical protein